MSLLFWCSLAALVYPLVIYPCVLGLLARRRKTLLPGTQSPPFVSILLSVYNEQAVIKDKIANFLALDYPEDRTELLVVSDGSDDATDAMVSACGCERVRLLRQEERRGKTFALNRAAKEARGDILFFTDADSMLKADCLKLLVRDFADPEVGLVSGRSVYLDKEGRETVGSLYRRYEEWIKEREGALYGIAGADGAVYALRKSLYRELPGEYINDLLHPVQVVLAGQKALVRSEALVMEPGDEAGSGNEFARQTRIMAQSWLIFLRHAGMLVGAGRFGFLWQFVSHKVLRWLAFPAMVLLGASAVFVPGCFSGLVLAGLGALCLFAWLGGRSRGGVLGRVCRLFMVQSLAGVNGLYRLMRGERFVTWKPRGN